MKQFRRSVTVTARDKRQNGKISTIPRGNGAILREDENRLMLQLLEGGPSTTFFEKWKRPVVQSPEQSFAVSISLTILTRLGFKDGNLVDKFRRL